ncbi:MAG TPA: sugar ABC transporter permease [Chloroflexota bacterium]|nr:sugar ABC transporter permease [Chloroflexota bacterium]
MIPSRTGESPQSSLLTAPLPRSRSRWWNRGAVRRNLTAYLMISPFMVLFIIFHFIPFFWAIWLSSLKGLLVQPDKSFVGFQNYAALTTDTITVQVFRNSFEYTIAVVPIAVVTSIAMAFLISNRFVRFRSFFRGVVYFPLLASGAAVALVWSYILAPKFGLLSYLLSMVGLPDIYWLSDPKLALWAILLVNWWAGIGFHVILFLAAMLGIPREMQEAARVDGANAWQTAIRVTIPLMQPVILFSVVMGTIWAFQLFDTVFVMTQGGPAYSTATIVWYIYSYAFRYSQVGMAAAMGVVLLLIIMPISLIQMRVLRRNWD